MQKIPDGFIAHFRKSPVTDPWEPLFSRIDEQGVVEIGVCLATPHCNSRGMAHGGLIASLADNAMGLTYARSLGQPTGMVTVNLNIDFVAAGQVGEWLQISPRLIRSGRKMGFVDALITSNGRTIARANAVFKNTV